MVRVAVGWLFPAVAACLLAWPEGAAAEHPDAGADAGVFVLPFDVPRSDRAPRIETLGGQPWVTAAAVGRPDPRLSRMGAMRRTARRQAEERARGALHRWVDDALARVLAQPPVATAAHRAVAEAGRVLGVRPLVDAGAVIVVGVPVAALRRAAPLEGVPWAG